jgi:hypothetical protein
MPTHPPSSHPHPNPQTDYDGIAASVLPGWPSIFDSVLPQIDVASMCMLAQHRVQVNAAELQQVLSLTSAGR